MNSAMGMDIPKLLMATIIAASMSPSISARVSLPQFFTDCMVVQREAVITIPGKARGGATVKIAPFKH